MAVEIVDEMPLKPGWRSTADSLSRTIAVGALGGALAGLVVGGVLGRLAMRLLAVTSPAQAQGRLTDDQAVVGRVSISGSLSLALATAVIGTIGGLLYLWVRRVLPRSRRGRILGFGLFSGVMGGAFFVHDHPSFDYTELRPAWLAVALFVALPALFGVLVVWLVENFEPRVATLPGRRAAAVVAIAALPTLPLLPITAPFLVIAFLVALTPALQRLWRSRFVSVAGSVLLVVLAVWGVYGLTVDIVSIATDTPATAPLNP